MRVPPHIQMILETSENQQEKDFFVSLSRLHFLITNRQGNFDEALQEVERTIQYIPESPLRQFFFDTYEGLKNGIN